ncbi:hypothetical protein NX79_00970 [Xanthomonas vasicola]|nr:hypothetical protein KWQ_0111395 [Xanthomonas vasicola pv. musacearum NCPPB 4380]KFA11113.1 hypothetical protein KWM_0107435 [Xanthomonas vasicola pv. musacearum NCPPB 2005]KFA15819.1 hypothetical protein A11G_0120620 [Xanthomonas vasicola pv. musacearum NCPPB 4392]KFA25933.1 hypothetical protein KWU_0101325 [Xanthomonas vasicola pv. musacearum NCPPB 4394]KFA39641.1 hypothetical protein KWS_0102050 [Xanthomonas vasicola pv. musacearum NCPPB 4384]KGR46995.1 hypothetical protein NX04_02445 [X
MALPLLTIAGLAWMSSGTFAVPTRNTSLVDLIITIHWFQEPLPQVEALLLGQIKTVWLRCTASDRASCMDASTSLADAVRRLLLINPVKLGMAIAATIARTATVTINSTRLKPRQQARRTLPRRLHCNACMVLPLNIPQHKASGWPLDVQSMTDRRQA